MSIKNYECDGQLNIFNFLKVEEDPKTVITDEYIQDHPSCFYVFGYYLDNNEGWHKVPDFLPT